MHKYLPYYWSFYFSTGKFWERGKTNNPFLLRHVLLVENWVWYFLNWFVTWGRKHASGISDALPAASAACSQHPGKPLPGELSLTPSLMLCWAASLLAPSSHQVDPPVHCFLLGDPWSHWSEDQKGICCFSALLWWWGSLPHLYWLSQEDAVRLNLTTRLFVLQKQTH